MTEQQVTAQKQGTVIGGWVCIVLGTALMFWTLLSFILYLPLFLAAFVLGIAAIAQRRLGHGIAILLLSVVVPLVIGMGLGAYRTQQIMEESQKKGAVRTMPQSLPGDPSRAASEHATPLGPSEEQKYIAESLELYDFQAKYMNAVLDGRVPGVTFKIKNKGDRSLELVKAVVLFRDAAGSVIAEEEYTPIIVSQYNLTGDNKLLKPGYIWQQERDKFYTAKSVPSEWKEGAAEAQIV